MLTRTDFARNLTPRQRRVFGLNRNVHAKFVDISLRSGLGGRYYLNNRIVPRWLLKTPEYRSSSTYAVIKAVK
jgi:hypothetical protein